MYQRELNAAVCIGMFLVLGCGRGGSVSKPQVQHRSQEDIQTVRLHFEGFTKSKSGAT
jgi:hypothetical protein